VIIFYFLEIVYWNLPFDVAQGGKPVEPFVIWVLLFGALKLGAWSIAKIPKITNQQL
jgi:hypothetical protein